VFLASCAAMMLLTTAACSCFGACTLRVRSQCASMLVTLNIDAGERKDG
jgi:hypothetical protein